MAKNMPSRNPDYQFDSQNNLKGLPSILRKPSFPSTIASTLEDQSSDDEIDLNFPFPTSK